MWRLWTKRPDAESGRVAQLIDTVAKSDAFATLATDHTKAAAAIVDAARRHTTATGDALKWFAAFSTAGLLALTQLLRAPGGELLAPAQAIGLVLSAIGFLVALISSGLFILFVDLPIADWLENITTYEAAQDAHLRTATTHNAEAMRATRRGDDTAAFAALKEAADAMASMKNDIWPKKPRTARWTTVTVRLTVGGFLIGVLAAVADFAVKMASVR